MGKDEMTRRITSIVESGKAEKLSITFRWGCRKYTLSQFRIEESIVKFDQRTDQGDDDYHPNRLDWVNDSFMDAMLANIVKAIDIDRNLF